MTSKARRTVKLVLGSLAGLVLLAVGVVGWTSSRRIGHLYPMEERSITVPAVPDTARGERLATTISLCTQCHQDDLGGQLLDDNPVFRAAPPNLTSGEGGVGVDLSLGQQFMVMLVCILGGIGTAGVPSGSLPVVALICAMVGVNPIGIGLILGVNHFLDMCRTTLNVTGDLTLASLVAKGERADVKLPGQPG